MSGKNIRNLLAASFAPLVIGLPAMAEDTSDERFFPDKVYEWNENADDICVKVDGTAPRPENAARAQRTFDVISKSASAQFLMDFALENDVAYCYMPPEEQVVGEYISKPSVFTVSSAAPFAEELEVAAHELRHMWQDKIGLATSTIYNPNDLILMGKFKEADAEAYSNLVRFELAAAGVPEFMNYAPGFTYGAITIAFNAHANINDNQSINAAMRAGFDAWFSAPPASIFYESRYIEGYESFVEAANYHYPVSYASEPLTIETITKLGELPNGQNYLEQTGGISFETPLYADLADAAREKQVENLYKRIDQRRSEFCAERPHYEAKFCTPYKTRLAP